VRGTPGSGKSTFAALLYRHLKKLEPSTKVTYLSQWPEPDYILFSMKHRHLTTIVGFGIFSRISQTQKNSTEFSFSSVTEALCHISTLPRHQSTCPTRIELLYAQLSTTKLDFSSHLRNSLISSKLVIPTLYSRHASSRPFIKSVEGILVLSLIF